MEIYSFNQYLVEKLGVSQASLQFIDFLNSRCLSSFREFLETNLRKWDNHMDKIPYNLIKSYIKDTDLYSQFPVVGFELIYLFNKYTDNQFNRQFPKTAESGSVMAIGGWAAGFGNRNWKWYSKIVDPKKKSSERGIVVQIGLEININKEKFDIDNPEHLRLLKDNIDSTMYHELNHSFEHYQRTIKGDTSKFIWERTFSTALTYAAQNRYKFPKSLYKFWEENFLDYIYLSEEFELRSNVQEMAYFLKKYPEKDVKDFVIYKNAQYMESFDGYNFYHKLLRKIGENALYKGYEVTIAERLKKMWVDVYLRQCESQKSEPIISEQTLEKMTCEEFIKYWGKKFNENGNYLKKKIYKLKSGIDEI
jgi:hypothetical protein